jgi:hypothetical protein
MNPSETSRERYQQAISDFLRAADDVTQASRELERARAVMDQRGDELQRYERPAEGRGQEDTHGR